MPLSGRITVTDEPTAIVPESDTASGAHIILQNMDVKSIFIGGDDVTTEAGFELKKGQTTTVLVSPIENIYGVVASGSAEVCYLVSGR